MARKNLLVRILRERCPNCGKGRVYEKNSKFFQLPVMRERCAVCDYRYDREPGYFLGAMYVSYGLAVLEGITAFLIAYYLSPGISAIYLALIVVGTILLFSIK